MKFLLLQIFLASFVAVHAQSSAECPKYHLVWVSCTSCKGMDFVGVAVLDALKSKGFDVDGNYVEYPANTPRNASSLQGAINLASDIETYANKCPNQTFILGGYSQGVISLHRTSIPINLIERIAAVTAFGDPVPGNNFYPICELDRAVVTCGDSDKWCNDPTRGPRDKEDPIKNIHVPGNHQSAYDRSAADAAINAIMDKIKNPKSADCTPPPQPEVSFDHRLDYES